MTKITSIQNPKLKKLVSLRMRKGRQREGLFLCEGEREVRRAIEAGFELESLVVKSGIKPCIQSSSVFILDEGPWKKLAMRESTESTIGIFKIREYAENNLLEGKNRLWLIADGIEKPGNLGAMLRTCDAVGASGVVLTNSVVDIFNPNVIRASQGAVFSVVTVKMSELDCRSWAERNRIKIYVADGRGKDIFSATCTRDWSNAAIVVGAESQGVSPSWTAECDEMIGLPMFGTGDSLNASVAAAVLMYEALRNQKKPTAQGSGLDEI